MASQRITLGIGLAVLLAIGAASIGLDVKSRQDSDAIDHTFVVLQKIGDLRLSLRRSESAARGFALTGDAGLLAEYKSASDAIPPAVAELVAATRDNPPQTRRLEETSGLITRRLAISAEFVRLHESGDRNGITALMSRAEGRATMDAIGASLDQAIAEGRQLLAQREAQSNLSGRLLLAIDLAGVALIVIFGAMLTVDARRARRKLQASLQQTRAANISLEAAVAERTAHLVAAHEELRRSTSVMESTFNSMAEAVLVIDAGGTVVLANPAAEKMLDCRPGTTMDMLRTTNQVLAPDGITPLPADQLPAARALAGEPYDTMEFIARPTSRRAQTHLVVSGRPLREPDGTISGAALVYHDLTASRETEHKLQQAQKLDAIGKLTGGVAHDFNNMLTVISGTTETLVAELEDRPALQKTAELIDEAAERCRELVQHLLAFARRQPLQPHNVEINSTVLDVLKLLRPTLGEQIEIGSVLDPQVTAAFVDRSQLAHAMLNMAINARDAMPDGGKLLLETRKVVLDEAYAAANPDVTPGLYVMLAISDTGTGMSQAVQDRVFEPFFTTKAMGKGSGLGMSMVYGFVKQSGGHIKIYSEEGHGTTIKLYLPPARGEADAQALAAATVTGGAETILVVEDDALVRNFVIAQLRSLGYRTVTAADGPAALRLVDNGEPFDLLFTDVIMPGGMTGRDLADEVSKRRPGTKVLYTSGYTDSAVIHHDRLDKGTLLLMKPYRKSQLAAMVRLALSGQPAPR